MNIRPVLELADVARLPWVAAGNNADGNPGIHMIHGGGRTCDDDRAS